MSGAVSSCKIAIETTGDLLTTVAPLLLLTITVLIPNLSPPHQGRFNGHERPGILGGNVSDNSDFILHRTKFSHLSDHQFDYVQEFCRRHGLDAWMGHVHAELRGSGHRAEVVIIVTIQALRDIAESTGDLTGRIGPEWCGADGVWRNVWLEGTPPAAARVGINRKGRDRTVWGVCNWDAFAQWKIVDGELVIDEFWGKMGPHMLGKCAEATAIRAAFSQRCGGLYVREEMMQPRAQLPTESRPVLDDDAPPSEFLFQLRLVRDFEFADAAERAAAVARMREKFPQLDGPEFYAAALRELADERSAIAG